MVQRVQHSAQQAIDGMRDGETLVGEGVTHSGQAREAMGLWSRARHRCAMRWRRSISRCANSALDERRDRPAGRADCGDERGNPYRKPDSCASRGRFEGLARGLWRNGGALPAWRPRCGSEECPECAADPVVRVHQPQQGPFVERGARVRDAEAEQVADRERMHFGAVQQGVLVAEAADPESRQRLRLVMQVAAQPPSR